MRSVLPFLLLAACGSDGKPMSTKAFGDDRPADLKTPDKLTEGKNYPLVVMLHGYSATGFTESALFHMSELTAANEALWIAPDGTTNSLGLQFWNAGPDCCDRENQNPDDVAYLTKLVEDIEAEWPIDDKQIYFIGHSNGGWMSYRMALERADMVAAVMSLAGNVPLVDLTPSQPVSVLHVHGTADATVPYADGNLGAVNDVTIWAAHDGCTTTSSPTVTLDLDSTIAGDETHGAAMMGCPAGIGVELWTLEGSSHIPLLTTSFSTTVFDWLAAHKR